ncbi:uncharacterized protein LOC119083910 [Bradysia coprophila]|uniref:uncharacterized protein LOC119083910 n=1 Tax=Bradysia coprophila TaxID=38358 RepID=UPI00187DB2E7|nr:uncharacterized protein LOC119083910 [Bradysia coprophila]
MSQVDAALTAQKSIGTKVRSKLASYNSLPIERKNYEYVKQLINEAEELRNEFNNNNEFLCKTPLLDSEHQYFKANYYDETIKYFTEYKALMQRTIHDLEEANPELKTGKTGDHVNLDNLFKHANENPKDISNATDTTSTRMGLLMQRLNDYIIAVHKAESENDIDQARTLANIIKSYSRIIEVQCDIISSPSCNIHDFFDMTDEMTRIIAKYEASKPSNPANWQSSAKLPKLNVPLFSGEYVKYKSFKELFQRMIGGQQQLDDCEKLAYLKGQLKGEPLRLLSALPIENASYAIAWKTLNDRYENCHLIMVQLMRKLKSGPKMERYVVESMKNITDEISESISLISNMGIPWNEDTDMLFYYIVEERIDSITMGHFQNKIDGPPKLRGYKELLEFLKQRISILTVESSNEEKGNKKPAKKISFREFKSQDTPNQKTSLVATPSTSPNIFNANKKCDCKEPHYISKCPVFAALNLKGKVEKLRNWKMCWNCLVKGHEIRDCKQKNSCTKCNRKHHTLMHSEKMATSLLGTTTKNEHLDHVFLATAIINVIGSNGQPCQARALLDSGSQINIITQKLCNKIKAKSSQSSLKINGVGSSQVESTKRASFVIKSMASGFEANLEAFVLKEVSTCQPLNEVNTSRWKIPKNINLADPNFNIPAAIDIIIGGELFFKLISIGQIEIGKSLPDLQNTVFGWVVTGKVLGLQQQEAFVGMVNETQLEKQIEKFWQLEERYKVKKPMTDREVNCEEYFDKTTMRDSDNGKFIVNLQFIKEPSMLGNSKNMAIRRFLFLERRFQKDPELKEEYVTFLREYENLGHMEQVQLENITDENYFIPHHAVRNPSSSTTKFRVVFDGSAKTTTNISLNEILANGPMLQDDLFSILVRFRKHAIVFSADITKMYRQVEVTESHQKWQMIIWREQPDQPLGFYKLKTLTYGLTCSSYLAIKALQTLAEEHKNVYPEAAKIAKSDFNVDDVMTGAENVEQALVLQEQLIQMCKSGHFELHKWCSNHPMLLETIPAKKREVSLEINAEKTETKALGVKWIPKDDIFMLSYVPKEHNKVTKRTVLSELSQLFDPLGFVNPVVVMAKIFLQEICKLKLQWDAAVPMHMNSKWEQYRNQLKKLNKVKLPRRILVDNPSDIQLHLFSDASEKAYGSVAYLRSVNSDGERLVSLVCSKSRVAPIVQTTLPRLELCAALLNVELAKKVEQTMQLNISSTTYWTDSEVVLSWVLSDGTYRTFVANRVAEIKRKTQPENWRYINTKSNPADLVSRGMTPEKLLESKLWWEGPQFLNQEKEDWPEMKASFIREITEEKQIKTVLTASVPEANFIDRINHRNSIRVLQRIVAYALRMLRKNNGEREQSNETLSITELKAAMRVILKHVQKTCFAEELDLLSKGKHLKSRFSNFSPILDADGLIRVGGRLRTAEISFDQRHPVLLPRKHYVTRLILEQLHRENMHAGPQALLAIARQKYWPEQGKQLAQEVVKNCVLCVKSKPKMMEQIMGDLPKSRTTIARAFYNVSVDFAGPVEIHSTIRGKRVTKGYICIFVCFTTKAVHMEAAIDLSIDGFICCLKRFVARRGLPNAIVSDNATNFKGTHNQLMELKNVFSDTENQKKLYEYCQDHQIEWKFCPARSPHFNGLAEAAVKSAKWHLRKMLHSARLTYDQLGTITAEIEAILNSRPLTPMSNNPDDLQPLTAGHFLIGGPLTGLEDRNISNGPKTKIWYKMMEMRKEFWRRWSTEYLAELQSKAKWRQECNNIKVGTLVILKEDNMAPLKWRMGRVTKVFCDENGKVRVVELITSVVRIPDIATNKKRIANMTASTHLVRRAIHRICPLPIEVNDEPDTLASSSQHIQNPAQPSVIPSIEESKETTEQSSEIEVANAETTIEEVSAIAKPQGKLLRVSNGREPPVIGKQPEEPIARRTRSKIKTTICSVATVAFVFLAFLGRAKAEQCQYKSFDHNQGLYFEPVGRMALTHDKWNIICVLSLDQLWSQASEITTMLDQLDTICSKIKPPKLCNITRKQFRQQVKILEEQNGDIGKGNSQSETTNADIPYYQRP